MVALTKINRRAWLALLSHRRRRARHALPTPVLRAQFPSLAVWDWELVDPYRWNAYLSLDGGATFQFDDFVTGDKRVYAPDGGGTLMLIVGVDEAGNEITGRSNDIRPDDALLPAPLLVATYPSLATWEWTHADPARWNAYTSFDDGLSYEFDDFVAGAAREYAPDGGGQLMFIVGVDANGNEVTGRSNAVRPDDALAPVASLLTDLAGYWPMDEDSWGVPRLDVSGNDWTLSEWSFQEYLGGDYVPIGSGCGKLGNCVDFSDGSGATALVNLTQTDILDGDFSCACWFQYFFNIMDGQGLISLGGTAAMGIRAQDAALNFSVHTDTETAWTTITTNSDLLTEYEWLHAAFVKEGSTLRIYLNGVLVCSGAIDGELLPDAAAPLGDSGLMVGCNPWGYPMAGMVDELGIWSRALSVDEIGQLYNEGAGLAFEFFE